MTKFRCDHVGEAVSIGKGRVGCRICRKEREQARQRASRERLGIPEPVDPDSLLKRF